MIKKLSSLVIVLVLLFACAKDKDDAVEEVNDKETTQIVQDNIEYKVVSADYTDTIEATLGYGDRITLMDTEYKFIEIVLEVKNASDKRIDIESLNFEIKGDSIEDKTVVRVEDKMHYQLQKDNSMDSKTSHFVRVFTSVKKEVSDFAYTLEGNGKSTVVDKKEDSIKFDDYRFNDVVKTDDFEFEIIKSELTKELHPSHSDSSYTYLSVDDDKESFFVYEVRLKNKSDKDLSLNEVFNIKKSELDFTSEFAWYIDNPDKSKLEPISSLKAQQEETLLFISIIKGSTVKTELKGAIGNQLFTIIEK